MDAIIDNYNPYKDFVNDDSIAINKAIKDVSLSGGGKVIITKGNYLSSSIELLDNVQLHLQKDAYIKLNGDLTNFYDVNIKRDTDINRPTWENCDYNGKPSKYFIYAFNKKNISITGNGTIDGNEEVFYGNVTKWHIEGAYYPRIPLIYFENCKNINLNGITLFRSAFWTVHLVGCDTGVIDSITIDNNLRMTNSDGIDPDHCKNLVIKNCNISGADDCIVLKCTEGSKEYGNTENITVSNCTLMSTSAAIKFGTESVNDFKNISFENINIKSSNRGISLQLRDSGNIDNVKFNNINIQTRRFSPVHWWGKAEAIAVTAVDRSNDINVGKITNIEFNNITTNGENGILIYGMKSNISDIRFNNINVNIIKKTDWGKGTIDLRPSIYNIIDGKVAVLHTQNANGVYLKNFKYTISEDMKECSESVVVVDSEVFNETC